MSIELEHRTKRYDGTPVVDNVSLGVAKGELFVMLGPSGSGQSTLLRMIAGAPIESGARAVMLLSCTPSTLRSQRAGMPIDP